MSEKTPLPFGGPEPLHLPKASPTPNVPGAPDTPSGVHRVVTTVIGDVSKMKRNSRLKMYGAAATLLFAAFGGKAAYSKGETIETKHARLEERQTNTEKAVEKLTARADAGEKAQVHTSLKMERVETMLEMELALHGVPKSKLPPKVEEPKGDEP